MAPNTEVSLERRIPLAEAASYLGISKWTLRSWARQSRITSYQIGKTSALRYQRSNGLFVRVNGPEGNH
jgi:excisionase family DNA binding protein